MAVDLLSWPAIHDAEAVVAEADRAWRQAQRRYRLAPHGEREARLRALQAASAAALRAGLELQRLQGAAGGAA